MHLQEVPEVECTERIGLDRNLRNLTVGNEHRIVQYDLAQTVRIAEATTRIVGSSSATTLEFEERLLQSMVGEGDVEYNSCFTT